MDNISATKNAAGRILLAASCRTRVGVWDLDNNTMLPGWPVDFAPSPIMIVGPYLVDMTGDGEPEVYVGTRRFLGDGDIRRIDRFWLDGTVDLDFRRSHNPEFSIMAALSFADLDGDGLPELVYSADSIYAVDATGRELPGFPWPPNGEISLYRSNVTVAVPPLVDQPVIFWPTFDRIHARRIGDPDELPGWPVPYNGVESDASTLILIPRVDDFLVSVGYEDSIYVWHSNGTLVDNFPHTTFNPRNSMGPYYLSAGLVNSDDVVDLIFTLTNPYLDAIDINGERVQGYPRESEFNNYADPISLFRNDMPGEPSIVMQPKCSATFEEGQMIIHAFQGEDELDGFPLLMNLNPSLGAMSSLALIPSNDLQTLHVAINTNMGRVMVYDWAMDLSNIIMEWTLPGGNNWASRIYQPYRLTPNSPPDIAVREPADTLPEVDQHHVQQFRIVAQDPDGHPVRYLFKLDGDSVAADSLFTWEFADTGRFVVAGLALDHHAAADTSLWEVVVTPENDVDPESELTSNLPARTELMLYPNPTNGIIQVEYSLPRATSGRLTLVDLLGRTLVEQAISVQEPGVFRGVLTEEPLPSGTYLVRLILNNGEQREKRVTVIR